MTFLKEFIKEYMDYMEIHSFLNTGANVSSILNRRKKLDYVLLQTKNPTKIIKLLQKPKSKIMQYSV